MIKGIGKIKKAKTVGDLLLGEYGWITPWQVRYDDEGVPVGVNPGATLSEYGGTACVRVLCQTWGYEIDVRHAASWYERH